MTPNEAISYIENYGWSTTRLGLDRTKALLAALGDPQKCLKIVHVAGSNGKGSTCAMLASIMREAGYKTGLYISPYIQEFGERIQIDGENIPGERLAEITERVKAIADAMEDHPSQFELVTAIALQYYKEENCDIVILEVGMGGALDSTNAIDAPEVAVITNIGLEHTEYLGNTLEEIAATKGGIIKTGCHCVCYDSAPEVVSVIRSICEEKEVPLTISEYTRVEPVSCDLRGQVFRWDDTEYRLPLLGKHQLHNAAVVLETVESLRERGWSISEESVRSGLAKVTWPARFEVMSFDPVFVLDGGHNPQCAEALTDALRTYLPERKIVFLLGVLADKDYETILDMMMPFAEEFVCVTPLSGRALPGDELARIINERGGRAGHSDDIASGVLRAMELAEGYPDAAVVAFGSLYLAGAVRTEFRAAYRKYLRRRSIKAREALTAVERYDKSRRIALGIVTSPEFITADTVMLYKWTKGEVQLDILEEFGAEKRLVYPLCVSRTEMVAVEPGKGEDAWKEGAFGIREPVLEKGRVVPPEEIDLVICPCSGFDEDRNRLGMGGGFYDRYLPKCEKAAKIAVAFEAQKIPEVPMDEWDIPVEAVFTERARY